MRDLLAVTVGVILFGLSVFLILGAIFAVLVVLYIGTVFDGSWNPVGGAGVLALVIVMLAGGVLAIRAVPPVMARISGKPTESDVRSAS